MTPAIELFPFQRETVRKVRDELGGNAIIADEVGLGKTIEAGDLIIRLIEETPIANILVCVPKALLLQWRGEMLHKFDLLFELEEDLPELRFSEGATGLRVLVSHSKISVLPREHSIRNLFWQLVVVDEAHRFTNPKSKRFLALRDLRRNSTILLTATPVQNSLLDLFWLSELVRPGILSHSPKDYIESFATDPRAIQVKPSRAAELKKLLSEVLTRTTRRDAGIAFTAREVRSITCEPREWEREATAQVDLALGKLGEAGRVSRYGVGFGRSQILQGLSSHPRAVLESFEETSANIVGKEIATLRTLIERREPTAKIQTLHECIRGLGPEETWLVFTERLATGETLVESLESAGFRCAFYRGALDTAERDLVVTSFRSGNTQILVSTSAGSEGLNLQTCRNVVNFDLHWNPLRMEQRIGRVHRLGQTQAVRIFNLVTRGSIDEVVLERLYLKLDLFQATVGEISTVLSTFEDDFDVERELREALEGTGGAEAFGLSVERIARRFADHLAKEKLLESAQPL